MAQPRRSEGTVESIERHGGDVITVEIRSDHRMPRFKPGQFVHLALDGLDAGGFWPDSRVFSVANAVEDRRTLVLTISRQGGFTSRIVDDLAVGDRVLTKGPYGDFVVRPVDGYERLVLIAGGTGVTPFSAYMDRLCLHPEASLDANVDLYYGAREEALLIYRALARRCSERHGSFRSFLFSESRPLSEDVAHGRLDVRAIVGDGLRADRALYFLSGPLAMIDRFRDELQEQFDVPAAQMLVDAWE